MINHNSLKLKMYLFSSAKSEQIQDQRDLPVEEKKGGISKGRPTYASGMTIRRKIYGVKIKPDEFSERLWKANRFLERQYGKEGDENTLSELRRTESSSQGRHGTLPV